MAMSLRFSIGLFFDCPINCFLSPFLRLEDCFYTPSPLGGNYPLGIGFKHNTSKAKYNGKWMRRNIDVKE